MRFILGMIFGVVLLAAAVYFAAQRGYIDFGADRSPSPVESKIAMGAVDAWTDRNAGDLKNPLPATEQNIVAGTTLYVNHCAGCHGVPSNPNSQFSRSFYPPVPGFFHEMPDMEDSGDFYIIKHGIRWTGMPAWTGSLSDDQIWQLILFLDNMHKLPPAASKLFSASSPPPPAPASGTR